MIVDYSTYVREDATLQLSTTPPTPIGGQLIRYYETKRFGGVSGLIKWAASGYGNGVSGITVVSSGEGIINIQIDSADSSGLDPGNRSYAVERMDSGYRKVYSEGYHLILPGGG